MVSLEERERERPAKHNFETLPPFITWGKQRVLRCSKTGGEKIMIDLQKEEEKEKEGERRWNLRARKEKGKSRGSESVMKYEKEEKRREFSMGLKRREIDDDFKQMVGHRPPRKPKKRTKALQLHLDVMVGHRPSKKRKALQLQLDELFPGVWLTEITADLYKVDDAPETGKK